MPRPHTTPGGRTHTIKVRVSAAERDLLNQLRGDHTLSDYIRARALAEKPVTTPAQPARVEKIAALPTTHVHTWTTNADGRGWCDGCHEYLPGEQPDAAAVNEMF